MTAQSAALLHPTERDILYHSAAQPTRQPVLVVQSRRERPADALRDVLASHDLDPAVVPAGGEGLPDPDPAASALAFIVGSEPLSEARAEGRLARELDWIRRADEAGTAILGIGHGARALALAFGGSVRPAERSWRGWFLVDTTVPHIIPSGPWLAWQHDVIALPPAAQLLAQNTLGPQAFRIGRHLGVQFHPEATPESLVRWAGAPDPTAPVSVIRRDPSAAAACSWRLLSSFIAGA